MTKSQKLKVKSQKFRNGQLSLQILILGTVAIIILSGFVVWLDSFVKSAVRFSDRASALVVAEAGIEYYRWHLAHDSTDYQDGTGAPGPYIHPYYDKNGVQIGQFSLDITAPPIGSTVVTIKSTGTLTDNPAVEKVIEVKMGIPSFVKYAAAVNADVRFGAGTEVFGEIHSNGGIRFDGLTHNLVTSALAEYDDPDHSGGNEFGVHTHVSPTDPLPPASVPSRTDVFEVGRQFPVPALDFVGITQDLAQMKSDAQADNAYYASSSDEGYHIVLKTDDTFDIYTVNSQPSVDWSCSTNTGWDTDWGVWSIQSETFIENKPFPAGGVIFVEDHLWVDGQINTARVTIASGVFPDNPSTRTNIIVNNDLLYTNYDGQDTIGLIAQNNFNVGLVSEDDIRIDAAFIAQNGRAGRHYYRKQGSWYAGCEPDTFKTTLTLNGVIVSNLRYGFAWGCSGVHCSGYTTRNLLYDTNLLFSPPPSFPLTAETHETISWEEVK